MDDSLSQECTVAAGIDNAAAFPIVALGSSAGGPEALREFLGEVPAHVGAAFLVIQHADADGEELLSELLRDCCALPVTHVLQDCVIQADHVYVLPAKGQALLRGSAIALEESSRVPHRRLAIDHLFRSVANELGRRAIAVVLSGSGSDGSLGLQAVREAGGVTLVQEPSSAAFDAMPLSAIATGLAETARFLRPGLPVLFTSGHVEDGPDGQQRTLEAGQLFLKKPYRLEKLSQTLREALNQR